MPQPMQPAFGGLNREPVLAARRGRPETWLRGSWNRWTHAQCFMPQLMQPVAPGGTGFLSTSVQVLWQTLLVIPTSFQIVC